MVRHTFLCKYCGERFSKTMFIQYDDNGDIRCPVCGDVNLKDLSPRRYNSNPYGYEEDSVELMDEDDDFIGDQYD